MDYVFFNICVNLRHLRILYTLPKPNLDPSPTHKIIRIDPLQPVRTHLGDADIVIDHELGQALAVDQLLVSGIRRFRRFTQIFKR